LRLSEDHRHVVASIETTVSQKDIKNSPLGVQPPLGGVKGGVPLVIDDEAIVQAVVGTLCWVKRQRRVSSNTTGSSTVSVT